MSRYRYAHLFGIIGLVIIASILVFSVPVKFFEPDELAYYFAAQNFIEGKLTITKAELQHRIKESHAISDLWPHSLGYVPLNEQYVFVKSPGFPFLLAILEILGIERFGNLFLLFISITAFVFVGSYFLSPRAVFLAVLLFVFSPITLVMLYRCYMSDFQSASFLFLAGLAIIFYMEEAEMKTWMKILLHLVVGFFLCMAFLVRYTNAISCLFLGAAHLYMVWKKNAAHPLKNVLGEQVVPLVSAILPLLVLLSYNLKVFGAMFSTGYELQTIRPEDTSLIILQLIRGDWQNVYYTLIRNWIILPQILVVAIPWVFILPAAVVSVKKELNSRIFWVLIGWISGILVVYLQYRMLITHIYVMISRMYLPLIAPAAILCAYYFDTIMPPKKIFTFAFMVIVFGVVHYLFFLSFLKAPILGIDLVQKIPLVRDVLCLYYPN